MSAHQQIPPSARPPHVRPSAMPAFGRRRLEGEPGAAPMSMADAPAAAGPAAPGQSAPPSGAPMPPRPMRNAGNQEGSPHNAAMAELRSLCLARVDPVAVASMPQERLIFEVELLVAELATERRIQLNAREQRALAGDLVHDMLGLGPLEPLLEDDSIADIMVNGPNRTFIERGGKVTMADVNFRDTAHLQNICQRIAAAVGRRIDESSPMVDARLKDGSRVNIVFPPLALDGPYLSIRKFGKKTIDFKRLIGFGALTPQVARILEIAGACRLNIIISGGTGSGKTTMMNALSRMIDIGERVVTVEDAAELQLQQPHVVRLENPPAQP